MKRVLILASVASMISQFNLLNINILQDLGYEVDVACNFYKGSTCDKTEIDRLERMLKQKKVVCFQIDFSRSILNLKNYFKAYRQVRELLRERNYAFIHCHSPIGGAIGRIAGYIMSTKVIYTAHGFHFYKGAPFINWWIYYPVEKILAQYTDKLITINKEDYSLALKRFKAKETLFVPGVGIDTNTIDRQLTEEMRSSIRKSMGADSQTTVFISVGELSKRKNHMAAIKALWLLHREDSSVKFQYYIVGLGKLENKLKKEIRRRKLEGHIFLLGYRRDIKNFLSVSDIFLFPSKQEGLPVALMEAMEAQLPVICSDIRGNRDLIENERGGYLINPSDSRGFLNKIRMLMKNRKKQLEFGEENRKRLQFYSQEAVKKKMIDIYRMGG